MDVVFAKSSSQNKKNKSIDKKIKDAKKHNATNSWQKDQNLSLLATSNILDEVNDVI